MGPGGNLSECCKREEVPSVRISSKSNYLLLNFGFSNKPLYKLRDGEEIPRLSTTKRDGGILGREFINVLRRQYSVREFVNSIGKLPDCGIIF